MVSNTGRIHNSFWRNVGRATQQAPLQVLSFRKKTRRQFVCNKRSLTAIRALLTATWESPPLCKPFSIVGGSQFNESNKSLSNFSLYSLCSHFTKHTWHVMISRDDHLMSSRVTFLALLHILRANLRNKKLFAVFWVTFCGYFILLVWYILKQLFPSVSVASAGYFPRRLAAQ